MAALCIASTVVGQTYNTNYTAPSFSNRQNVESTITLSNGDLITVGTVREIPATPTSAAHTDMQVVRTNSLGVVQWSYHYGQDNISERGNALVLSYDADHVIVVGSSQKVGITDPTSISLDIDLLATKIRISDGAVIWANTYGKTQSREEGLMIERALSLSSAITPTTVPPLYTVVGTTFGSSGVNAERLYSVGILDNGFQVFGKRYEFSANSPLISLRPTSYTRVGNRMVIAGLVREINRPTRLFTYGINVFNGIKTDDLFRYELSNTVTASGVSITSGIGGFGMAFTVRNFTGPCLSTSIDPPFAGNRIAVMRLDNARKPKWGNVYWQTQNNSQSGVGIQSFIAPLNTYGFAVAVNTRGTDGVNRPGLIRVLQSNGNVVNFHKYNNFTFTNSQHRAMSMVRSNGGGYAIKSRFSSTLANGFSIARTSNDGSAPCSNEQIIRKCAFKQKYKAIKYADKNFGGPSFKFLPRVSVPAARTSCFLLVESEKSGEETPSNGLNSALQGATSDALVYPSPLDASAGTFNVKFNSTLDNTPAIISVVNALGQEVVVERINILNGSNLIELDATNLAKGLHIVTIKTEYEVLEQLKLMKQ